jgi:hypothetical protein
LSFLSNRVNHSVALGGFLLVISSRNFSCVGHGSLLNAKVGVGLQFCCSCAETNRYKSTLMLPSEKEVICFALFISQRGWQYQALHSTLNHGSSREKALIDVVIGTSMPYEWGYLKSSQVSTSPGVQISDDDV